MKTSHDFESVWMISFQDKYCETLWGQVTTISISDLQNDCKEGVYHVSIIPPYRFP